MRQFIDIITKPLTETELLMEKQDYMSMINPIISTYVSFVKSLPQEDIDELLSRYAYEHETSDSLISVETEMFIKNKFSEEIAWVRNTLRRHDRIIWYLRFARFAIGIDLLDNDVFKHSGKLGHEIYLQFFKVSGLNQQDLKNLGNKVDNYIIRLQRDLEHFMSMPIPNIQNFEFKGQSWEELKPYFLKQEKEWKEDRGNLIPVDEDDKPVIQFTDGFAWVHLSRASCRAEGDAMGHCGNAGSPNPGDTILSLRKLVKVGNERFWQPALTFILDKDHYLGEMKGRGNDKPAAKYHPYILRLLESSLIKGIKGGGYLPQHNFSVTDLTPEQQEELMNKKPEMATPLYYYQKNGLDETLKQKVKSVMSGYDLKYSGFSSNGEYAYVQEFNNWQDMLEDLGDDYSKKLASNIDDMFYDWDFEVSDDSMENLLTSSFKKKIPAIGKYLQQNNSEEIAEWLEYEGREDDFDPTDEDDVWGVIKHSENDFYDALRRGVESGERAGAEEDCFKSIEKTFARSLDGIGGQFDVRILFANPNNDFAYDTTVYLAIKTKDFLKIISNGDNMEIIENDGWIDEKIKIEEPYYGWSGWNEEVAAEVAEDDMPDYSAFENKEAA